MLFLKDYSKKIDYKKIILLLFWIGSVISVNTTSITNEIINYIKSSNQTQLTTIDYINFLRFFFPFFIFFFLVVWFFFIKKKIFLLLASLLFFYNSWQIIISILTQNDLNIGDYQVVTCSLNVILILYIAACNKYESLYKIFLYILLIFIVSISIYFLFKIYNEFIKVKDLKYFYFAETIIPETRNFNQANPRSTGIARMLVLIFYFLFFIKEKYTNKKLFFIYFMLFFIFMTIYGFQARGALIGIPILIGYYIFFIRDKILKKFLILIFIFILPIITFESIFKFKKYFNSNLTLKDYENENTDHKLYNRLIYNNTSSGRTEIWENTIAIIKEKKIIFGAGPMADRKLLTEYLEANKGLKDFIVHENNASNALIYSYLSGGVVCFSIFIMIYFLTTYQLYKGIFINKIFIHQNYLTHFSIITLFYLTLRSIYENSFAFFGIDFFFYTISYFCLFQNNSKKL